MLFRSLNRILTKEAPSVEEADRSVRSESRKQRHRAQLRRRYLGIQEYAAIPDDTTDARLRLRIVKKLVSPEEFSILRAVGEGFHYDEIATADKMAAGAIRTRVFRLRRLLAIAS